MSLAFSSSSSLRYATETTPCILLGRPALFRLLVLVTTMAKFESSGGSPTNTNQGNNLPLLNSSEQEVERLMNKIRQSFGIRDSPNPPPYILRNGEMECKDYNTSCSEFQRDGYVSTMTSDWIVR
ncbi:hypothetical protein OSTOST_10176 [Ostertagia ostertagi]